MGDEIRHRDREENTSVCVCVCVCVCERERERERVHVCVLVCVYAVGERKALQIPHTQGVEMDRTETHGGGGTGQDKKKGVRPLSIPCCPVECKKKRP